MANESAYHDGYRKALEEVSGLVNGLDPARREQLGDLVEEIHRRIENARILSRSSLAAQAGGDQGY